MWLNLTAPLAQGHRRRRVAVALGADGVVRLACDGQQWRLGRDGQVLADGDGAATTAAAAATHRTTLATLGDGRLRAPMAGRIVQVVDAGQTLAAGASVLVMEAMKMEHRLVAPAAAVVIAVRVAVGEQVTAGQLLVELSPP